MPLIERLNMSQMIVSARSDQTGIMIRCPRCRFSSRYDVSFVEDAINHGDAIKCVACGEGFRIVTRKLAMQRHRTRHAPDLPEQNGAEWRGHKDTPFCECAACMGLTAQSPHSKRSGGG